MSREFDLTHTWNRYVTKSVILAEPSIFESTLYAASWLPFPFPHIDVVVAARGIDLADVSSWAALVVTSICSVLCYAELCCAVLCIMLQYAVLCVVVVLEGFQACVHVLLLLICTSSPAFT